MQEWSEQKLPKLLPGYSGGRLLGRRTKVKGSKEGEVDESCEEGRIRCRPRIGCRHPGEGKYP